MSRYEGRGFTRRRSGVRRGLLAVVVAAASVLILSGIAVATDSVSTSNPDAQASARKTKTISMKLGANGPFFSGAGKIRAGDFLRIVNLTDPTAIGPHTFSLIKSSVIPNRGAPCGQICSRINAWHSASGNVVKAGRKGWDREGTTSKRGDSWFTGNTAGTSFKRVVSVKSDGKVTLDFMCAIHPNMQGKIRVFPRS